MPSILKGLGYLISTISVLLLGTVSWNSASQNPILLSCLVAGMSASVLGMLLRWLSHRREEAEKQRTRRLSGLDQTGEVRVVDR